MWVEACLRGIQLMLNRFLLTSPTLLLIPWNMLMAKFLSELLMDKLRFWRKATFQLSTSSKPIIRFSIKLKGKNNFLALWVNLYLIFRKLRINMVFDHQPHSQSKGVDRRQQQWIPNLKDFQNLRKQSWAAAPLERTLTRCHLNWLEINGRRFRRGLRELFRRQKGQV